MTKKEATARVPAQEYFDNYGGKGGYNSNYKMLGFDVARLRKDWYLNNIIPETVLDAGSATGQSLTDLRNWGFKSYGIEANKYALDQTPAKLKRFVKLMDIRDIGKFKKDSFDACFCNALMYLNVDEIKKFLQDSTKVFTESLYISVPYKDYPLTIPKDEYRENLESRKWWIDTCKDYGWKYCRGTELLFKKD